MSKRPRIGDVIELSEETARYVGHRFAKVLQVDVQPHGRWSLFVAGDPGLEEPRYVGLDNCYRVLSRSVA